MEIPLDKGCARGMWPLPREGLHQCLPFYNCDVCGEQDNTQGVRTSGGGNRSSAWVHYCPFGYNV
jgi:hypothetical protein